MVEAPLQCQIRDIVASDTLALRQIVLRPDLVRVDYRGDDLPTTSHFGAYVDGRLHAIDKRASCVWCVARCSAEPVYEKMGFQRAGQDFRLEGIGQVCYMIRALL
ncbi:hypothetical protein MRX96_022497 [Rhipicephalus microplus]